MLGKAGAEGDDRLNISSSGLFGSSLCGLDDDIGGIDECCDEAGDGGNKDQSYKGRDLLRLMISASTSRMVTNPNTASM